MITILGAKVSAEAFVQNSMLIIFLQIETINALRSYQEIQDAVV
jgi:hypothetical protein